MRKVYLLLLGSISSLIILTSILVFLVPTRDYAINKLGGYTEQEIGKIKYAAADNARSTAIILNDMDTEILKSKLKFNIDIEFINSQKTSNLECRKAIISVLEVLRYEVLLNRKAIQFEWVSGENRIAHGIAYCKSNSNDQVSDILISIAASTEKEVSKRMKDVTSKLYLIWN